MAGATRTLGPAQMVTSQTIYAADNNLVQFQSITVSNITTATTCFVFLGAVAGSANPFMSVGPGTSQTLPCAPVRVVTLTFVPLGSSAAFDGSVTFSGVDVPLSAGGLTSTPAALAKIPFDFSRAGGFNILPLLGPEFTEGLANTGGVFITYTPQPGQPDSYKNLGVYLTDLTITGNDVDRVWLEITLSNASVSVGYQFRGNLRLSVPGGLFVGTNDASGSYGLFLLAKEAYLPPLNLLIAACAGYLQ